MNRKSLDFFASPTFLILSLLIMTGIVGNIGLKEPVWVGGPIAIVLIIIYFVANNERNKVLSDKEKREERDWDEPHGPA
ncbi:MAG: hypothetical protein ACOYZ6_03275 [Chloroflexota bacterium]